MDQKGDVQPLRSVHTWPNGSGIFTSPTREHDRVELGRIVPEAGQHRVWKREPDQYRDLGQFETFSQAMAALPLPTAESLPQAVRAVEPLLPGKPTRKRRVASP